MTKFLDIFSSIDECQTCGIGSFLPSGVCDHCNTSTSPPPSEQPGSEPVDHNRVNIPIHENEAALMVLLGTDWLERNAPHRLRTHTSSVMDVLNRPEMVEEAAKAIHASTVKWLHDNNEDSSGMEPWESCKEVFILDAQAAITAIKKQMANGNA
ncbi:hypothetical protein [Zavarzinella formosa]|uniref:hypothetical protein n=1 Tax=Zavarzinella formosa TaxID=360055 RepID=UPI000313E50B|nr:hypothetical protein [Zavarzinella formosa]